MERIRVFVVGLWDIMADCYCIGGKEKCNQNETRMMRGPIVLSKACSRSTYQ